MYIFDLDGTIAETRENRKLPPIAPIIANVILYKELAVKNDCIVVSGRDDKQSPMVLDFMNEHFK